MGSNSDGTDKGKYRREYEVYSYKLFCILWEIIAEWRNEKVGWQLDM